MANKLLKIKNRIKEFINLVRLAYWEYRWQLVLLSLFGFISGLVEGVGVNVLIPLFSFITDAPAETTDVVSKTLKQVFLFTGIDFRLRNLLILIVLLFIAKALILLLFNYIRVKITAIYMARTRDKLFTKTLESKWSYLMKQKLGYLENVIMTDVKMSGGLLKNLSTMLMTSAASVMYILIL